MLDSVTAIEKATQILSVANQVVVNVKGDWTHDSISKVGTVIASSDIKGVKQIMLDSETAIDVATDIIPLANKVVVNIPGYWSSSLISKVATLVVVTSWRITSVEQIELGSGQYSYSKSDVDNVVVIMPVVTRKVSIVLNRLPDSMGSRQWQDLVDSCGQIEVLGFIGGRLDRSGGREVVEWLGKVGRAQFLWVDF